MDADVVVIGAGAAGLMAARVLSAAGKKIVVLEARDRIGGRICPLSEEEFGYPAQGGAEFLHGETPVTADLMQEAGLTRIPLTDAEAWDRNAGTITKSNGGPTGNPVYIKHRDFLNEKLAALNEDMSLHAFIETYVSEEKYAPLRQWIFDMAEGYDAADPKRVSMFTLREEWLGGHWWEQARLKEGYGALVAFLERECKKNGVEILVNRQAVSVDWVNRGVSVGCMDGGICTAQKVIVTLPLPLLSSLAFTPTIPEKMGLIPEMGYGSIIKILMRFRSRWWEHAFEKDLGKMLFFIVNEEVRTWWTQYPDPQPVLTAWISHTHAEKYKGASDEEILAVTIENLARDFETSSDSLRDQLVTARVLNWARDPFSRGSYSYATLATARAIKEFSIPVDNRVFFAGEALYSGSEIATVEGALGSGKEVAEKMLEKW